MTTPVISIKLPDSLYKSLKKSADKKHRSVEAELMDVVTAAIPVATELPDDLDKAVSSLDTLDNSALWQAAQSILSPEARDRLEELHFKMQSSGITEAEAQEEETLLREYERAMLVRAEALYLLKLRGVDVSSLLRSR